MLAKTLTTTFVILKNHASAFIRKERLSSMSKARRKVGRNKFVEKGRMPDRVKSFGEVNSSKNCPRTLLGFVKPIQNGLIKIKNFIKSRHSRVETSHMRIEN